MNKYFNGFATDCVTLPCEDGVKVGDAISLSPESVVYTSYAGTGFMGICTQVRDNFATVAFKGYAELSYEGDQPIVGFLSLVCAADGKVKVDDDSYGINVMVVSVDTEEKKIGVIL